jgi:TIR domain
MGPHNVFATGVTVEAQRHNRVFLSHRSADKEVVRGVALYFESLGLYYYLDEQDAVLQQAAAQGAPGAQAVVTSIDNGLNHATHLLGVLSRRTMGSWWVPYEIGGTRARGYPMAYLVLPSITADMLPEYVRICPNLWTPQQLFEWASPLANWPGSAVNDSYRDWLDGAGPFAELGPDEEEVENWFDRAKRKNKGAMDQLQALLRHCDGAEVAPTPVRSLLG